MIRFTIYGEPASKSNSRKQATIGGKRAFIDGKRTVVGGRAAFIKSEKARDYEREALRQVPPLARQRIEGPCRISIRIFYATERPDLDESVILDCLQDRWKRDKHTKERYLVQKGVVRNDRQFREKHIFHAIDKTNPRAEIEIEPLLPQEREEFHMKQNELPIPTQQRDPF